MSSRRSEIIEPVAPSIPSAPMGSSRWWDTPVRANLPLLLALLAVWGVGFYIEGRNFDAYNRRIVMLIGFNIILAVSLQLINGFSGQFSLGHAGFMAVGAYLAAYPAISLSQRLSDPFTCLWFYVALGIVAGLVGAALLLLFWGIRRTRRWHRALPMALLIMLFAWIVIDLAVGADAKRFSFWMWLFTSISRSFEWLMTHGQGAALRLSGWLPEAARQPLCFIVLVVGGGCCAGVVGLIVGMPALRLRGDYLAIATLGFAEIIRILIQNSQPLGGALGLTGIPKYTSFAWLYGFAVITIAVIWRVAYSAKGTAIMAVREDEVAAAATGVDPTHHKVVAFIIGSFFGGVAGALFALHERSIAPYQFGLQKSIEVVVMVTLGGLGSISGAMLAAAMLTYLLELLREPHSLGWYWIIVLAGVVAMLWMWRRRHNRQWLWWTVAVFSLCALWELGVFLAGHYDVKLADFRMIIYSLTLVLMMLLRPQGLLGGRELWFKRRSTAPTLETAPRQPEAG
jgi:ABC-type branched-subunit amino acid transport system permease subunit